MDPATDLCTVCGADHGAPCEACGGRAYHLEGCRPQFRATPAAEGIMAAMAEYAAVEPQVGDLIHISNWNAYGMVAEVKKASGGSYRAVEILLEAHPHQDRSKWRRFRLEPGEYRIDS